MKKMTAGLAAVAISLLGGYAASAGEQECNGNLNSAHCDLDGDGANNKTDEDDDGDGVADDVDPCPRDAADACDDGEGGGEDPGGLPALPVDPEAIAGEVVAAAEEAIDGAGVPDPGTLPVPDPGTIPVPDPGTIPDPGTLPVPDPTTLPVPDPSTLPVPEVPAP